MPKLNTRNCSLYFL